jgi:uncharacterized protein
VITPFEPVSAAIGGALIGLSAALMMLLTGRIAGISGILGGAFTAPTGDRSWRFDFIIGLIAAALIAPFLGFGMPAVTMPAWPVIAAAGLLIGFGTRLGSGCTSGHGVCGIARLSPRSLAATAIFMAVAVATVFVTRHVIGGGP